MSLLNPQQSWTKRIEEGRDALSMFRFLEKQLGGKKLTLSLFTLHASEQGDTLSPSPLWTRQSSLLPYQKEGEFFREDEEGYSIYCLGLNPHDESDTEPYWGVYFQTTDGERYNFPIEGPHACGLAVENIVRHADSRTVTEAIHLTFTVLGERQCLRIEMVE